MYGGPIFRGWNEILLLGRALKFGVLFLKYALKIINFEKLLRKFEKKCKFFGKFVNFLASHKFLIMGKIRNIIMIGFNGGFGGPPKVKKFQEICQNR